MTTKEWLQIECGIDDLDYNDDGSAFIPIRKVKLKLNSEWFTSWGVTEFEFKVFSIQGMSFCSASGILNVEYMKGCNRPEKRSHTGGATFRLVLGSNENFEATALAEVIKNAAKNLGPQFGFNLNQELKGEDVQQKQPAKKKKTAVKLQPDAAIIEKWDIAIATGNKADIKLLSSLYEGLNII